MAELKTKVNDASVEAFLNTIEDAKKRQDCFVILDLMREVTGAEPKMWGSSIIGFGATHYKYASGRDGDWFLAGFSPRKQNLTLYITGGFDQHTELMQSLGKHKLGKGCLYINKLSDIDQTKLRELVKRSVASMTTSAA